MRGRGGNFRGNSSRGSFNKRPSGGFGRDREADAIPETVVAMGTFVHSCEGEMVCKSVNEKVPYFNAPIYLENKSQIGKVDEIFGPINEMYFTIKVQEGIVASSFKANDKLFISTEKLLPLERFLPKPKAPKAPKGPRAARGASVGGSFRGGRGGSSRGSFSGGRGSFRGGASRGGISKGGSFGGNRGGSSFGSRGRGSFRGGASR